MASGANLEPKSVNERYKAARQRRMPWISEWRNAYDYAMPNRQMIDMLLDGQKRGLKVFDSTGINAAKRLANRIQSLLFPPFQKFFELEPGPSIPKDQHDAVRLRLHAAAEILHSAITHSNFNTAINEALLELIIGTCCVLVQKSTDTSKGLLYYAAVPTPTVMLNPGPRDAVADLFRENRVPAGAVKDTWPGANLGDELTGIARDKPHQDVTILELTTGDFARNEWHYQIYFKGGEDALTPLLPRPTVFRVHSPWVVARWNKNADEVFGRGPVLDALPDIMTANKVVELILKNASMAIAGVYTGVNDGVFNPNTVQLVPGAVIAVNRNPGHAQGPSLAALERPGDFNVSQLVLQDLREQINTAMYNRALPSATGPVRSATELIERMKELQIDIGAAFGRLNSELITPIVLRSAAVLLDQSAIDIDPAWINGQMIKVVVTSPLATAQNLDDVQSVVHWLQLSGMAGPEMVMYGAKVEELSAWFGEKLGVDPNLIRDEHERGTVEDMVRSYVQKMMQQQQQGAGAAMATSAGPGGNPPA